MLALPEDLQGADRTLVLAHDRTEEAYAAFKATRAESTDITDENAIQEEFHLLNLQLVQEKQHESTYRDLFTQPSLRKRCIIGFLTLFAAQGTATLVINSMHPSTSLPEKRHRFLTK